MPYSANSPEKDLLQGCRANHRLAQKYLYQRYYGKMLGICMRYTSQRDEADDLINRAFLKVFKNIHQYKPTGSLDGWIARIVFNTSIDYVRSQKKYRQVMHFDETYEEPFKDDMLEELYAEDIYKLVQQLPQHSQVVFSLFAIDGYKHKDIAELLGISVNTSKWHLMNAKNLLKDKLRTMVLLEK